eukprot:Skav230268  [mRNA]  locus=scaffold3387:316729:319536:+ [translate_table: standard]
MAKTAMLWELPDGPMRSEYKNAHVLIQLQHVLTSDETKGTWKANHVIFSGLCCKSALPEVDHTPRIPGHQVLSQPITVVLDPNHVSMIRSCHFAMTKKLLTCFTECTIRVFQGHITVFANKMHSGVAVWSEKTSPISRKCAELFSGGFGGWSFAMRTSQKLIDEPFTTELAIDCDMCSMEMYAANHDAMIVPKDDDLRGEVNVDGKTKGFVTHIQDAQWFHWIMLSEIDIFLSSPPCPSWSYGSDMQGYFRVDGQQTLQLAKVCRLNQPKAVLLENVNGFQSHPHFRLTVAVFKWAGYKLVDTFDSDLADVSVTTRKRWIGTSLRQDIDAYPATHEWFKAFDHTLDSLGFTMSQQPQEFLTQCILSQDLLEVYGNKKFLPSFVNFQPNAVNDPMDVCNHRLVKLSGKFGVFMSMYGRQHELPEDTLKRKKLFAELMPADHGQVRFITPVEQAICYMVDSCEIPKDLNVAFACLGNAISPPQAVYALHSLETILGCDSPFTPMDLVLDMAKSSLKPSQVQVIDNGKYWKVCTKGIEVEVGSPSIPVSPPTKKTRIDEDEGSVGSDIAQHEEDAIEPVSDHERIPIAEGGCEPTAVWTELPVESKEDEIPENPVLEWFTVTFLMPFDTMSLRVPKGANLCQILMDHGFQIDYSQLRDVYTGNRVEHQDVTSDMLVDVHTDHESDLSMLRATIAKEMDFLRFVHENKPWTNVTVAYRGRNVWSGVLPNDLPLRELHETVSKAFYQLGIRCDLRWTHMARALNPFWSWTLDTISQAGSMKLHVHLPVIGGGGSSVDDDLRNQLVALLANHSVPFTNLVTAVAQICYKHKANVIRKILQMTDPDEKWKAMVELGKTAGVALRIDEKEQAATKIQREVKGKGFTQQVEVDIASIKLLPGSFVNADGTEAQLSQQAFSANGQGVVLATLSLRWHLGFRQRGD